MRGTPIRADQVGSLLRPQALLEARRAFRDGHLAREALIEQEDAAIRAALDRQRQIGFPILTDGEFRRGSWITDMAESVEGFEPASRILQWHGPGGGEEASTSNVVGGKLRAKRRLTGSEAAFLKQHAAAPFKVTLPAPSNFLVSSWRPGLTDQVYASREAMLDDLVAIVRAEVEALIGEGVPYVQLDAPFYYAFLDERAREQLRAQGTDPDAGLRAVVAADHAALEGLRRDGLTLGLHICRGNSRSRWLGEGAYDPIAEAVFGGVGADVFLLEYDSPRDGGFEPLRFVANDATVVLGLVTTKEPSLESADELKRRIDEASQYVPLERLALSPQCGFASVAAGNLISEDDQWRKLELVLDTTRQVWG